MNYQLGLGSTRTTSCLANRFRSQELRIFLIGIFCNLQENHIRSHWQVVLSNITVLFIFIYVVCFLKTLRKGCDRLCSEVAATLPPPVELHGACSCRGEVGRHWGDNSWTTEGGAKVKAIEWASFYLEKSLWHWDSEKVTCFVCCKFVGNSGLETLWTSTGTEKMWMKYFYVFFKHLFSWFFSTNFFGHQKIERNSKEQLVLHHFRGFSTKTLRAFVENL